MPITEWQKNNRAKYIGSSDTPAILGLSPWRSAADVALEKRGMLEPITENEAMGIGKMIEDPLLDWAASEIGARIIKNQFRVHNNGIMSASHDALVIPADSRVATDVGLEAKTTRSPEGWGDQGTDQIPQHVAAQVYHQMAVAGLRVVWVPVLIGSIMERRLYRVERDEATLADLERALTGFWNQYIIQRADVALIDVRLDVLKRLKREPNKTALIDPLTMASWLIARDELRSAEAKEEKAKAELIAMLGDAEAGEGEGGRVTYFEQTSRRLDAKALQIADPEVAARYMKETKSRVLRLKK